MIEALYYPQSPYLFNIIEPNMLGKIYEMFLTEQLELLENNTIGLGKRKHAKIDPLSLHLQKSLNIWLTRLSPRCVPEKRHLRF